MQRQLVIMVCIFLVGCGSTSFSSGGGAKPRTSPQGQNPSIVLESDVNTQTVDDRQDADLDAQESPETDSAFDAEDLVDVDDLGDPDDFDIVDVTDVLRRCDIGPVKTLEQDLHYPATANCAFGQDGNLPADNGTITARVRQTATLELPDGAVLCELALESVTQEIQYDDFLYFLMDEYVLAGDSGLYATNLEVRDGLKIWDWERVRGMDHDDDLPAYCASGSCSLPGHDETGPIVLRPDPETLATIALDLLGDQAIDFHMISMGDNDDEDCQHTDLLLRANVRYVVQD